MNLSVELKIYYSVDFNGTIEERNMEEGNIEERNIEGTSSSSKTLKIDT